MMLEQMQLNPHLCLIFLFYDYYSKEMKDSKAKLDQNEIWGKDFFWSEKHGACEKLWVERM